MSEEHANMEDGDDVRSLAIWLAVYGDRSMDEQTEQECDFVEHFFPRSYYPSLLDLACGAGRHSIALSRRGYTMTGVDVNEKALDVARAAAVTAAVDTSFVELDMLSLDRMAATFDGILVFWQSFGFFSGAAQAGLFSQVVRLLRPGGRLLLDLFNALHYRHDPRGRALLEEPVILTTPFTEAERLTTMVGYEDELGDPRHLLSTLADPNLASPGEIAGLTANFGLHLIASCSDYSPKIAATGERPRMQLIFERE